MSFKVLICKIIIGIHLPLCGKRLTSSHSVMFIPHLQRLDKLENSALINKPCSTICPCSVEFGGPNRKFKNKILRLQKIMIYVLGPREAGARPAVGGNYQLLSVKLAYCHYY